jgi:hypothetical protein
MVQFSGSSIASIVVSILVLFVLIFNVVYIGGVRNALDDGNVINLSPGAATFIYWVDIILIVLVILYLIYIMFVIFTSTDERANIRDKIVRSQNGLGTARDRNSLYMPKQP